MNIPSSVTEETQDDDKPLKYTYVGRRLPNIKHFEVNAHELPNVIGEEFLYNPLKGRYGSKKNDGNVISEKQ